MDLYLNKYDLLDEIIVYDFKLGHGGLGDCIKFFMYLLQESIKNNTKIYYLTNNISIEKYLKLKHSFMYITHQELSQINKYKIITPGSLYNTVAGNSYDYITIPIQDVFIFTDEVKNNSLLLLNNKIYDNYTSLHLRLGDKYLETDKEHVLCKNDTRAYNEIKMFKYIENNYDKNIIFFSDNNGYKLKLMEKYKNIIVTSSKIGHTSLSNTTDEQILDGITELFIMSNSTQIIAASNSGFSQIASKFKHVPFHHLNSLC